MVKVVVVDDEPVIAETLSLILRHAGYEVDSFLEPERAIEFIADHPVSLVLTDMSMPSMTGVDLAVKVSELWPQCHVLILSGKHRLYPAGPLDFDWAPFELIHKPVYPADLLSIVARMVKQAA
jgi:DNA-binding NtrC family response regulator